MPRLDTVYPPSSDEVTDFGEEWYGETAVFAPDEPDVIRANMTPVSSEWLISAYHAVFPKPKE